MVSERFSLTDLQPLGFSFKSDLQREISALETLAQFMLLFVVTRHLKHARVALTLPSLSDNAGAESSSNRLFSTNLNHALILEKMALLSCRFNMFLDVSHIAGVKNDQADALSRWEAHLPLPFGFTVADRERVSLSTLWNVGSAAKFFPEGFASTWDIPTFTA